ncbi:MAG: biotin--[acetyl-CoA-carboxylase] ligase [Ectothiorhodospiraceae bacterium]|nr:biotin--[acetyl-CoA-carboxylase] ligase [Chromatiales bacterium]MCP5153519.1 biotin--[acetyl-CoA-carboxylase] ligase [Ectothiorhodospiraceae bacterium]
MSPTRPLLALLASGRALPGDAICARLGIDRPALGDAVQVLRGLGVELNEDGAGGLGLPGPLELLDAERIRAALAPRSRAALRGLDVHLAIDSTNRDLLDRAPTLPAPWAVLAEVQTAGRGRRGRRWRTPIASGLALSVLVRLRRPPGGPQAFALVMSLAVAEALETLGLPDVGLKWPNDIVWGGAKLGGLLAEASWRGEECAAVAGIGLNVALPPDDGRHIDQPWTDLRTAFAGRGAAPGRDALAARVIDHVLDAVPRFEAGGFEPFRPAFEARSTVSGRRVRVLREGDVLDGRAVGVDADGALLVDTGGEVARCLAGDVSVRAVP